MSVAIRGVVRYHENEIQILFGYAEQKKISRLAMGSYYCPGSGGVSVFVGNLATGVAAHSRGSAESSYRAKPPDLGGRGSAASCRAFLR